MCHIKPYAMKPMLFSVFLSLLLLSPVSVFAAESDENVFYILANEKQLTVQFSDTVAARELNALLDEEDLTIDMTRNSFEQYGELGRRLSSDDAQYTAQPGDVLLYKGDTVCLFYGTNRYAYTRLGTITDADGTQLKDLLSGVDLTITLTKQPTAESAEPDSDDDMTAFMARLKALFESILSVFRRLRVIFTMQNV